MDSFSMRGFEHNVEQQPDFGRRLLTTLIDERAQCNHSRPFASIPRSANPKDGYRDISYRLFATAIDRCAWWLKQCISLSNNFEAVIYLGAFDLRYQILASAAIKTGHVMFFISPRNSVDAQLSLIDDARASKILVSSGTAIESILKPILQQRSLQKFVVPELEDLLFEGEHVPPFEFHGTFDEYRMKPWILLHTSGSTSFPKIVTIKHGYATSFDAYWLSAGKNDLISALGQRRMFIPFPPFHMAGIVANLACSMYVDATVVLPPASAPLTAELVNDICVSAKVEIANLPPFILMEMIKNPTYLECLRGLKDLAYGGGPLPQETGDALIDIVGITSFFGSTEACIVPALVRPREHWKYYNFDVDFAGIEFRLIENSTTLYELVFVRDPKLSLVQAIFVTFTDIDEYHSKDLFTKHPTEPDLWKYEGRLDDIIVLNNAEKINPVPMEGTITSCPQVRGALVVGTGRFQTGLLVETDLPASLDQVEEKNKLLNLIWPFVEMANQQCPAYGRISRELIGFARSNKPFMRASKGTIQRAPTLQAYAEEINDLYAHADSNQPLSKQYTPLTLGNVSEIEDLLHTWFKQGRLGDVQLEQDFFNRGMDSLDVVNLIRHLRSTGQEIPAKQVYDNSTIKSLAESIYDNHDRSSSEENASQDSVMKMEKLFHELKFQPTHQDQHTYDTIDDPASTSKHIVLIGSTGSLGPYLLNNLLANPNITKITCLNRSADAPLRQKSKHSAWNLITDFQRVTFLKSNMSEANLGLAKSDYEELLQTSTHIIFNAWTVNFNQTILSFTPLLQSVRNVIEFTYKCTPRRIRLFFMSSVSVADRHRVQPASEPVREAPMKDWNLAEMGYGQSKLVAEALISDAVERYGIDAAICRLCQLGGPVMLGGEWNQAEWIPSLIYSSKAMGMIPKSLGPVDMVDWLPIDLVADICLELLFHDESREVPTRLLAGESLMDANNGGISRLDPRRVRVWHVVNPTPTLWSHLLSAIVKSLPTSVKPVDFVHWVDRLMQESDPSSTAAKEDTVERVPSLKLIPLFERLKDHALKYPQALAVAAFDTKITVACSKTLAEAPAVNSSWVELWMKQWKL